LHTDDRVAGLPPCLLPLGILVVPGGRLTKRPVGIIDLEALPVVLDRPGALPPGTPAPDRLRHQSERINQVGGLLQLGNRDPLAGPQRQLAGDLAVVVTELVVAVRPCLVVLLRRAGIDLGLGGPLGLPRRQRPRPRILRLGVVAATEQAPPSAARMLRLNHGELLLRLLPAEDGAFQHPPPVRWRLVQLNLEPIPLGAQLRGWGCAHVQLRGGVDRQSLATRPGQRRRELVVGVDRVAVGQIHLARASVRL
jgi:hypothetical protein